MAYNNSESKALQEQKTKFDLKKTVAFFVFVTTNEQHSVPHVLLSHHVPW
jgi:hypothetical protein